jgi:hypothetical protein
VVAIRQRRLDPFALFLLALFTAGLALGFVTGDARFILAKDAAMSCTAGLVFMAAASSNARSPTTPRSASPAPPAPPNKRNSKRPPRPT